MQEQQMKTITVTERSVDLVRLAQALLKRVWLILLVAILCGTVSFGCSKLFIEPTYRSSFTAYVNNRLSSNEGQDMTSTADINASRSLTYLYQEIILSRSVLMDAAEDCGIRESYASLLKRVSTSVATNAAIISVYVEAESPREAEQLASAIAKAAPEHVARVVDGSSMRIVDYPVLPQAPFAPDSWQHGWLGFVIAIAVMAAVVILIDVIVDKVDSPREMEERYGITVVGVIPDMAQQDRYAPATDKPRRK